MNSNEFSNESLKEAIEFSLRKKNNLIPFVFIDVLWLKNIFHFNDKIVIALKTSYNIMEYFLIENVFHIVG